MAAVEQPKNIPKSSKYFVPSSYRYWHTPNNYEDCVKKIKNLLSFIQDELSQQDFRVVPSSGNINHTLIEIVGTNYGLYISCDLEENRIPLYKNFMCFTTAIWLFDKKILIEKPSWGYAGIDTFHEPEEIIEELKRVRELALSPPRYPCRPDYVTLFQRRWNVNGNQTLQSSSPPSLHRELPEKFESDNDDEIPTYLRCKVSEELKLYVLPVTDFSSVDSPPPFV